MDSKLYVFVYINGIKKNTNTKIIEFVSYDFNSFQRWKLFGEQFHKNGLRIKLLNEFGFFVPHLHTTRFIVVLSTIRMMGSQFPRSVRTYKV